MLVYHRGFITEKDGDSRAGDLDTKSDVAFFLFLSLNHAVNVFFLKP